MALVLRNVTCSADHRRVACHEMSQAEGENAPVVTVNIKGPSALKLSLEVPLDYTAVSYTHLTLPTICSV